MTLHDNHGDSRVGPRAKLLVPVRTPSFWTLARRYFFSLAFSVSVCVPCFWFSRVAPPLLRTLQYIDIVRGCKCSCMMGKQFAATTLFFFYLFFYLISFQGREGV